MFHACIAVLILIMVICICTVLTVIDLKNHNFGLYRVLLCIVGNGHNFMKMREKTRKNLKLNEIKERIKKQKTLLSLVDGKYKIGRTA